MEGGASYTVHWAGVSVVGLQILLIVADGALVDQTVLCPGEVRGSVSSREVERKSASLPRDDPFCVAFGVERRRERINRGGFSANSNIITTPKIKEVCRED